MPKYSLGLDFGTGSCRALVVRLDDGEEVSVGSAAYESGEGGVISGPDPNMARQYPGDYLTSMSLAVEEALRGARGRESEFSSSQIAGIGVAATASTPMPVDSKGSPLALEPGSADNPDSMAWLWKDHTSAAEAEELTALVSGAYPEVIARVGGSYSSEWYWAKALRCARVSPHISERAHTWVELQDWIPAVLTDARGAISRGVCAAGHKGLYSALWGGFPPRELLATLHPDLARFRDSLPDQVQPVSYATGGLCPAWAQALGIPQGTSVATGGIDAHMGAVGAGVAPGRPVKILGTSSCDIAVSPLTEGLPYISGISGIVPESVLPGMAGIEAGQAAVGDLFNWWSALCGQSHEELAEGALALRPGESGLLALDWNNGNRSVLADPRLSGLILGQTLHTGRADVYRALIEAAAFGARIIIETFEAAGVPVNSLIACGGIAEKSPLTLQIYANVCGKPIAVSRSRETCALGAAMAGAVASKALPDFDSATAAMCRVGARLYEPDASAAAIYGRLFQMYRNLHDAFGRGEMTPLGDVMEELGKIRAKAAL